MSAHMDTSYLSQQVNTIIGQLHGLFDEIGVPIHERETREAEVFAALSETLNAQLRKVTTEKNDMIEQAEKMVSAIRQMEVSLDGANARKDYVDDDDNLQVTFPLIRCLQLLKDKQIHISRLHRERFEQVKKLVEALESYSSHLEPSFVKIVLPPTSPGQPLPVNFDLSPAYVDKLDAEFTRVYDEYVRRVGIVKTTSEQIISLWAELGTPQAQTDASIVKYYRDSPEQLGLHASDLDRLRARRDKLADEKKARERKLQQLRLNVEALWQKLGIDEAETKTFVSRHRGCGLKQIADFEAELARLNELKRQNLHVFVEDARARLQELWDSLYFSEDEMLEFTPAFSDVYSDALLEAHEREIVRLEALKEQNSNLLALIEKHQSILHDKGELEASSQDASRLMMRGQKGEKRDPTRLLREEKMRKRIAKELPKVTTELRKLLEDYEEEHGSAFMVRGERYLFTVEANEPKMRVGAATLAMGRSKTPSANTMSSNSKSAAAPKSVPPRAATSMGMRTAAPPSRAGAKTPVNSSFSPVKRSNAAATAPRPPSAAAAQPSQQFSAHHSSSSMLMRSSAIPSGIPSPSRLPMMRPPLSDMKTGSNSPTRPRGATPASPARTRGLERPASAMTLRAPPPKMRLELGQGTSKFERDRATVRSTELEDVYVDRPESRLMGGSGLGNGIQTLGRLNAAAAAAAATHGPGRTGSERPVHTRSQSHFSSLRGAPSSSPSAASRDGRDYTPLQEMFQPLPSSSLRHVLPQHPRPTRQLPPPPPATHGSHESGDIRPTSKGNAAETEADACTTAMQALSLRTQKQETQPQQGSGQRTLVGRGSAETAGNTTTASGQTTSTSASVMTTGVASSSSSFTRQPSATSHTTVGSENWETYDDELSEEPEPDASEAYFAKVRAQRRLPAPDLALAATATSASAAAPAPTAAAPQALSASQQQQRRPNHQLQQQQLSYHSSHGSSRIGSSPLKKLRGKGVPPPPEVVRAKALTEVIVFDDDVDDDDDDDDHCANTGSSVPGGLVGGGRVISGGDWTDDDEAF